MAMQIDRTESVERLPSVVRELSTRVGTTFYTDAQNIGEPAPGILCGFHAASRMLFTLERVQKLFIMTLAGLEDISRTRSDWIGWII